MFVPLFSATQKIKNDFFSSFFFENKRKILSHLQKKKNYYGGEKKASNNICFFFCLLHFISYPNTLCSPKYLVQGYHVTLNKYKSTDNHKTTVTFILFYFFSLPATSNTNNWLPNHFIIEKIDMQKKIFFNVKDKATRFFFSLSNSLTPPTRNNVM